MLATIILGYACMSLSGIIVVCINKLCLHFQQSMVSYRNNK